MLDLIVVAVVVQVQIQKRGKTYAFLYICVQTKTQNFEISLQIHLKVQKRVILGFRFINSKREIHDFVINSIFKFGDGAIRYTNSFRNFAFRYKFEFMSPPPP